MGLQEIQNERFENSEYWPKQDSEVLKCLRFTTGFYYHNVSVIFQPFVLMVNVSTTVSWLAILR